MSESASCTVDECDRVHFGRGMCAYHYKRWHRAEHGREPTKMVDVECTVCGTPTQRSAYAQSDGRRPTCGIACRQYLTHGTWPHSDWRGSRSTRRMTAEQKLATAARGSAGRTYAGRCVRCGDWFTSLQPNVGTCSAQCGRRVQRSKRRALKRGAYIADVNRMAVFERDKWTCQLCGKAMKRDAQVPHPMAPTIDHVIPLANGGTHEPANVQAAHFICNARKSDHEHPVKLALVG